MVGWMDMADHLAALIGEHDQQRVRDFERPRLRALGMQHRSLSPEAAAPFCFAHFSS
jgi:hypothetical protein